MESKSRMEFSEERISLRKVFDKKTIILLGFAAVVLIFYFILEDINIFDIFDTFINANWVLLIIGASFAFIAVLLDTITWKLLLSLASIRPPTLTTYRIQLSSFSYGLLIPSAGAVEAIMRVIMGTQEFVLKMKIVTLQQEKFCLVSWFINCWDFLLLFQSQSLLLSQCLIT